MRGSDTASVTADDLGDADDVRPPSPGRPGRHRSCAVAARSERNARARCAGRQGRGRDAGPPRRILVGWRHGWVGTRRVGVWRRSEGGRRAPGDARWMAVRSARPRARRCPRRCDPGSDGSGGGGGSPAAWTLSASVSPTTIARNHSVTITSGARASVATGAILSVDVWDPADHLAFRKTYAAPRRCHVATSLRRGRPARHGFLVGLAFVADREAKRAVGGQVGGQPAEPGQL